MELSRRNFLKSAAAVAGAAGVSALAATTVARADEAAETEEAGAITYDQTIKWDGQYDVVVVGFGAAGSSASIAACDAGASVLLLEKAPLGNEGGNTRYCAQCFVSGKGDLEEIQSYYKQLFGEFEIPDDMFEFYTEGIAGIEDTYAELFGLDPDDYLYMEEGASYAYATLPVMLGMSPEYPEYASEDTTMRLASLHQGFSDAFMWECYREQVVNRSDGIDVWLESPVVALIQEPNTKTILGVTVERGGEQLNIRALNGVVLACGGFENNPTMVKDYLGLANAGFFGTAYNTGDGINMAKACGADLWHMHVWESSSANTGMSYPSEQGERASAFGFSSVQGSYVFVGGDGYRFWDESEYWARHGHIYHNGTWDNPWYPSKIWLICDNSEAEYIEGTVAGSHDYYQADTIEELAALIGTKDGVLEQTVADYNFFAENGYDYEFKRDADSMHAIEEAPFYAVEATPCILNTQGGPRRNANAEVVDVDGNAIPHLYSAGECGGITSNQYQGGGNMAECLLFGQLAGKNAAVEKDALEAYVVEAVESDLVYTLGVQNDLLETSTVEDYAADLADNEYVASATGIGGEIIIKLTTDDGVTILDLEVLEEYETDSIGGAALEVLVPAIVEAGTVEGIDGVSGATVTSTALFEAIADCLAQAQAE